MRAGSRAILDAQRFAQVGTWSGTLAVDGDEIDRRPRPRGSAPATARGASARSARPSRRARRRRAAVRGLLVALRPAALRGLRRRADRPGGRPTATAPSTTPPGLARRPGRAARLAAGRHRLRVRAPASRRGASIACTDARRQAARPRGRDARLAVPLHVGGGLRRRPRLDPRPVEGPRTSPSGSVYDLTDPSRGRPRSRSA